MGRSRYALVEKCCGRDSGTPRYAKEVAGDAAGTAPRMRKNRFEVRATTFKGHKMGSGIFSPGFKGRATALLAVSLVRLRKEHIPACFVVEVVLAHYPNQLRGIPPVLVVDAAASRGMGDLLG
jgi:hypothetical protein